MNLILSGGSSLGLGVSSFGVEGAALRSFVLSKISGLPSSFTGSLGLVILAHSSSVGLKPLARAF